ncbi:F-box/kelch-repeat protein At3g23880-like [Actinidia eriantha]|uniref:F-box/kelch-repeat protein At3g23880-like n=1 Tax=Actinidia eriantha TaxID=165200 RepID=UPI00258CCB82|nr:F-box/kelch-repeat protein At3g23880-like [Actinidia eriantha]
MVKNKQFEALLKIFIEFLNDHHVQELIVQAMDKEERDKINQPQEDDNSTGREILEVVHPKGEEITAVVPVPRAPPAEHKKSEVSGLNTQNEDPKLERISNESFQGRRMGKKKTRSARRRGKKEDAKAKVETSFSYIPEDITFEILSRVPIKSLLRFLCVSKRWRSLVSSITAPKIGKSNILVQSYLKSSFLTFHSIDEDGDVKHVCRPWKKRSSHKYHNLVGSCNGLLLLQIDNDLFLWNPLTSFFKKVLSCGVLLNYEYEVVWSGLCYDPSTDEYKAVMAFYEKSLQYFVAVGNFKSQRWLKIDPPHKVFMMSSGPVVNGYPHWYASSSKQIIYFNSRICEFENVPMPQPKHHDGDYLCGLGALDGCLCMIRWENPRSQEGNIEVLLMKEYGVEISWTIMFTISNLNLRVYHDLLPLGYTKNGEVVMTVCNDYAGWRGRVFNPDHNSHIIVFNPDNNTHREIPIQPEYHHLDAIFYEESLVTPTGYN